MILTTHILSGAAIGENIHNPWLVVILSLAVHFSLDTFRHGDYLNPKSTFKKDFWKSGLDLLLGFFIVFLYFYIKNPAPELVRNILLGTFISVLPDASTFLYRKMNVQFLKKIYDFHQWLHQDPHFSSKRNWNLRNGLNDIIFSLIALLFLFF